MATGDYQNFSVSNATSGGSYWTTGTGVAPNSHTISIGGGSLLPGTPAPSPCQFSGHEIFEITEFRDDLGEEMYGACAICGERIKVKSQPGGVSYAEVKDFFADLLVGVEVTGDILAKYKRLTDAIREEREALEHAEDLLQQATEMLRGKGL